MNKTTQLLYKYRPIDGHTLRTISHSEVYFPLPKEFNDPFDSNVIPEIRFTEQDAEDFIRNKAVPKSNADLQKMKELVQTIGAEKFRDSMRNDLQKLTENLRVCCLSEIPDSVLMFSHYARGHRGVCLEFNVREDDFFDLLRPVKYADIFPTIFPIQLGPATMHNLWPLLEAQFLTKSVDWSYEKEWRIIKPEGESTIYKYSEDTLSAIIFGCQTSKEAKELILEVNEGRSKPAVMKEAYIIDKTFSLGIRPYIP